MDYILYLTQTHNYVGPTYGPRTAPTRSFIKINSGYFTRFINDLWGVRRGFINISPLTYLLVADLSMLSKTKLCKIIAGFNIANTLSKQMC